MLVEMSFSKREANVQARKPVGVVERISLSCSIPSLMHALTVLVLPQPGSTRRSKNLC